MPETSKPALEVITRRPEGPPRPTPLLFVHGSYGGAWVWDRHFLPFFARHGYVAHALSLRGHGRSAGRDLFLFTRLRDYVADLEQVVAALPSPPVLIGHSLGGMVVQHALRRHRVPGVVLMASVPPRGLLGSILSMMTFDPWLFWQMAWVQALGPWVADPGLIHRALVSEGTPPEALEPYYTRFQHEPPAVVLDLIGLDLPPSRPREDLPALVLGAAGDRFVYRDAVEVTARSFRTRAEVLPELGHAMMLDRGWEAAARHILVWLEALSSNGTARTR